MPSVEDIIAVTLRDAGLSPDEVAFAIEVARGESSFDSSVRVFDPAENGDPGYSHGIFQLRSPGLLDAFTNAGYDDWRDPVQQAKFVAGYIVANRGDGFNGWSPWTVARNLMSDHNPNLTLCPDGSLPNADGSCGDSDSGGLTVEEQRSFSILDFWLRGALDEANRAGNTAQALALERLRHDLQFDPRLLDLANQSADIQLRIDEANRNANHALALELMREKARIDEQAIEKGALRDVWFLLTEQAFQSEEAQRARDFQAGESALGRDFQAGESALGRDFAAGESALGRENVLRSQAIGEFGALHRQAIDMQGRARELLAQLQPDPLRASISGLGGLTRGTTPGDAFRNELTGIIDAPLPTANLQGPVSGIQQAIASLGQRTQLPTAPAFGPQARPGPVGLEHGGELDAFAVSPGTTGTGILVGEGGPGASPEVLELIKGGDGHIEKIRVIPLATRAAHGLELTTTPSAGALGTRGLAAPTQRRRQAPSAFATQAAPRITNPDLLRPGLRPAAQRVSQPPGAVAPVPLDLSAGGADSPFATGAGGLGVQGALATVAPLAAGGLGAGPDGGLTFDTSFIPAALQYTLELLTPEQAGILNALWTADRGGAPTAVIPLIKIVQQLTQWEQEGLFGDQPPVDPPPEPTTCTTSNDCPPGQECVNGVCVAAEPPPPPATCPPGQHLENGICVPDTVTCPAGQHEENGICVPDATTCTTSGDCPPGQECVNGICAISETPSPIITIPPLADIEASIRYVQAILDAWPNFSPIDVLLLLQEGFQEAADILNELLAGLGDPASALIYFQALLTALQAAQQPGLGESDTTDIRAALGILFQHLGIDPVQSQAGRFGSTRIEGGLPAGVLDTLGIRPTLLRNSATGQVFFVQDDGTLVAITEPGERSIDQVVAAGFTAEDIISLSPEVLQQQYGLQFGATENLPPVVQGIAEAVLQNGGQATTQDIQLLLGIASLVGGAQGEAIAALGQALLALQNGTGSVEAVLAAANAILFTGPIDRDTNFRDFIDQTGPGLGAFPLQPGLDTIVEPNTGLVLPAPRAIAQLMGRLQIHDPVTARIIGQAYELAGFPLDRFDAEQAFFTPSGNFQREVGFG